MLEYSAVYPVATEQSVAMREITLDSPGQNPIAVHHLVQPMVEVGVVDLGVDPVVGVTVVVVGLVVVDVVAAVVVVEEVVRNFDLEVAH